MSRVTLEVERLDINEDESSDEEDESQQTANEDASLPLNYDDDDIESFEVFGSATVENSTVSKTPVPKENIISDDRGIDSQTVDDIDVAFGIKYEAVRGIPTNHTFGGAVEEVDDETLIKEYNIKTMRNQADDDDDDEFGFDDDDGHSGGNTTSKSNDTIKIALTHAAARYNQVKGICPVIHYLLFT
jgi:hypothetical protein